MRYDRIQGSNRKQHLGASNLKILCISLIAQLLLIPLASAKEMKSIAGVYPHLTMYNSEGECGTGAVVSWANKLWVVTYGPHKPLGSSDKLYEINNDLTRVIRPESIGGTPANRMIHRESNQLSIGPYLIDSERKVRVLSPKMMPGRLTGTARHLSDPEHKIYIATMEEGLYSVDVESLAVTEHIKDGNAQKAIDKGTLSKLPGYHGKGLYAGQGLLIYANNGERSVQAKRIPSIPSGALASWKGTGDWQLVRRNQFTEVTGPGGIYGNEHPATDPVWSLGWDYRSLILMLLDGGQWHTYRLPKGSHSYDGAHGWNTEWPRIRDIGEEDLLATMHGTFWRFPRTFSIMNSAGIEPRSNYLKVVGDFATWNDQLVLGCDDSAKKEFLNTRPFKAIHAAPVQSNSNLWFIDHQLLDQLGPAIGRGSVWLNDNIKAGQLSDPYLFNGYDYRTMAIRHESSQPITFTLEVDKAGNGQWSELRKLVVHDSQIIVFPETDVGVWIRVKADADATAVSIHFNYRNRDLRTAENDSVFSPVSQIGSTPTTKGLIRSNRRVLSLQENGNYYELNQDLEFALRQENLALFEGVDQPTNNISVDSASAVVKEDGKIFRIPKNDAYAEESGRICREVATERDLFNFQGTFFELPARNAQGFAKIRPIATHNLAISDYASHFGLMFLTGLNEKTNSRVIQSQDGKAAVWAGVIDDLWKLGKPRGKGGPWNNTVVKSNIASDPYLMTGYDQKSVELETSQDAEITIEVDIDGTGVWVPYKTFRLRSRQPVSHHFPEGFSAYWVRATCDVDCQSTATFIYQ